MAARSGACLTRTASRCLLGAENTVTRTFTRTLATEAVSATPLAVKTSSTPLISESAQLQRQQPNQTTTTKPFLQPLQHEPPPNPFITAAQCTLHSFPELEPVGYATYPSTHLLLPLRKDLLHLAVTYEADGSRQGTASTKWRGDVHGSNRKIRPQKGSGSARLGDKKSPMLRGGGVAFGPKPRDFSTELPEKMYHLAWRTALSYRYRRGQLTVVDGEIDLPDIHSASRARYLRDMFVWHKMGHSQGRTLLITAEERPDMTEAFEEDNVRWHAELLKADDVDVKDLLELGRLMIEKKALDIILHRHQKDLSGDARLQDFRASLTTHREPSHLTIKEASPPS